MSKKSDLIDRNELYNQIRLHLNRHSLGETAPWTTLTTGEIASIIANMPAIEVEPVRHGKWCGWSDSHCSECGCFCTLAYIKDYPNYCPNCGAKMEEQ